MSDHILEITTTLGNDQAFLTWLDGEEQISQPFLFNIRFVSAVAHDKVAKLLGTAVSIKFGWTDAVAGLGKRALHGHIRRLRRGKSGRAGETEWHAEVVPMLWFLSRTSDCRIFQDKSVPDIITEILEMHGVTKFEKKLLGSYEPRTYVVQYRESALDFISRLMEEEGIFYWHEHKDGEHKLVIADDNTSTPLKPQTYDILGHDAAGSVVSLDEEIVVRSGKWTLRDFNFETPSNTLEKSQPTTINVAEMKARERYDYPGIYEKAGPGGEVARKRIENEETFHLVRRGESAVTDFFAGAHVKIGTTSDADVLLTEVRHHAEDYSRWPDATWAQRRRGRVTAARGGNGNNNNDTDSDDAQTGPTYSNEFVCIPYKVRYRPERVTPRPFVQGPQTAFVTGPSGEEIHTDKYGRVKVQFHWDRMGQKDDHTSCWIRVSQGWAGKNWGQMHIPRIGHEVIVDFLEGNPDRPIITGRVYNADHMVPYDLPANKTQSGIKSNSSKGGGGSNEFRFEDKKGSEQVYFHAEKDLDSLVENNETRKVGGKGTGNRTTDIKNDEKTTIKGNKTTKVEKNFKEDVLGTETRDVTGDVTETFSANESRTISGSQTENIAGSITQNVGGTVFQTITGSHTQQCQSSMQIALTSITMTAPDIKQISPKWFKTGAQAGDAYGMKIGVAALKIDTAATSFGFVPVLKMDVVGIKIDIAKAAFKNEQIDLKKKAIEFYKKNIEIDFSDLEITL